MEPETTPRADVAILNATVITLDEHNSLAAAVCITGNTISFVGSVADATPLIGPETTIVSAEGRSLIPGINDSHHHLSAASLNSPPASLGLRPEDVADVDEICERVREASALLPAGEWIIGSGWHAPALRDHGNDITDTDATFTRQRLDAATSSHPVALIDLSCHSVWVNTAALESAGIDPHEPTVEEHVVTDQHGHPTGLLKEAAQSKIFAAMPRRNPQVVTAALAAGVDRLNALGITSITEPGLGAGGSTFLGAAAGPEVIAAYEELARSGRLSLRVNVLLLPSPAPQGHAEFAAALDAFEDPDAASVSDRLLRIAGVKIFADGVPMLHTSCFADPYLDLDGESGSLTVAGNDDAERVRELQALINDAHSRGYQVGVHATGDLTAEIVVDAFLSAIERQPLHDMRHYVIHGSFASETSLQKLGASGLGLNWSPEIHASYAEANVRVLGEERVSRFGPVNTALAHQVRVACSSDAPIGSADWRGALAALLDRRTAQGSPKGESQRISLLEALRAYTATGAWQDHAEAWKGSIEPGKVADLVLIEGDLLQMTPDEVRELRVQSTYFDGELVYSADTI